MNVGLLLEYQVAGSGCVGQESEAIVGPVVSPMEKAKVGVLRFTKSARLSSPQVLWPMLHRLPSCLSAIVVSSSQAAVVQSVSLPIRVGSERAMVSPWPSCP